MTALHPLVQAFTILSFTILSTGCATAQTAKDDKSTPAQYVNSTPAAYAVMQSLPKDQPLQMLNLIQFNETANYAPDSEFTKKGWSGPQAYAEYTRLVTPIANKAGAKPIYMGQPQLTLIGPDHEKWDAVFILEYADLASFMALVGDPEYKKHAFHRSAAIKNSRLIRMTPPQTP